MAGQPATVTSLPTLAVLAFMFCLISIGGTGCRNLYSQTQSIYPADSSDRLRMRIQDAQQAERRAEQASAILHQRLAAGISGPNLKPDVDRFELAALDFQRHLASARDAAQNINHDDRTEGELARLERRATQLRKDVQIARQNETTEDANALEPQPE